MHRWFPVLLAVTLLIMPAVGYTESVRLFRDAWGVPHIEAETDAGGVFGHLYAQAQDNFWQLEDTMIQALGRYAEVVGEQGLGADYVNRALGIVARSKAEWVRMDPEVQDLTRAAAAGVNHYLADSGTKPRLLTRFEPWFFVAYSRFATYQLFIFNRSGISADEITAFTQAQLHTAHFAAGSVAPRMASAVADAQAVSGSNAWAVAPSRSRSGHAMLFVNPHQPYFGPGQWYEAHLRSAQGLHFSGAGFFGSMTPTIGHNDFLGWTHTVNEPDILDVYSLELNDPVRPTRYRYGDGERNVRHWQDAIRVRVEGGFETRRFDFYASHHGPVLALRDGKGLALRMAKFEAGGQIEQRLAMVRARSLDEFKQALARLASPMFNTMYADVAGNIFYAYYGAIPRRDAQFDWSKPVDGGDPATEWQGYHPLDELPIVENPASGYLQNCNATPFLATAAADNLDPKNYPDYMVGEQDNNRSRMSRILLAGERKFSLQQFERMTWDTRVLEADVEVPRLAMEVAARDLPREQADRANAALRLLQRWNRRSSLRSDAMSVYFFYRYAQRNLQIADPVGALLHALDYMQTTYGDWRVPWGDINRLQRRHTSGASGFDDTAHSLPVAGGPGNPLGIIFNFYGRPAQTHRNLYGIAGHSYVAVVAFAPQPQTRSIMVFGASADPESPHYLDQSERFAQQRYKPAWFSSDEVEKNATLQATLQYGSN